MSSWIDKYKRIITSSHKQHIIVTDVDSLFNYSELKEAFEQDGYKLFFAGSALDVRILFELQVRETKDRTIIVAPANYRPLPDIETLVQFQTVGLGNLFPNLDPKAIKGLSFNALCLLSNIRHYEELGPEKTLKFLLENLYNVDFDTLTKSKAKERILNALITVLLEKNGINEPLRSFLSDISRPYLPELVKVGLSKENLIEFIQAEWSRFVENGNSVLDFSEPLLGKAIGYLFAFEYLKAMKVSKAGYDVFPKHLRLGIFVDEQGQNDDELAGLIDYLTQEVETIEDLADQWFKLVQVISSAKLKSLSTKNEMLRRSFKILETSINNRFQRFIDNVYGSLFSLSGVRKPVVVSRILEFMNAQPARKRALFVIDGMNYWQWALLYKKLAEKPIKVTVGASLAYIPTITAWSRQAIFKGDKPDLDRDNSNEASLFKDYWQKHGVASYQVDYKRVSVNQPISVKDIPVDITVLGIVCNDLDEIMHGSTLGNEQLETSTRQWIDKLNIVQTISDLTASGYEVYLTSDHGSVESTGIKNLSMKEKVGAISRGKRHLHFSNEVLFDSFLALNPNLAVGKRTLSIYLKNEEAFTKENNKVVTHGGSHFWEVIVPFICINE